MQSEVPDKEPLRGCVCPTHGPREPSAPFGFVKGRRLYFCYAKISTGKYAPLTNTIPCGLSGLPKQLKETDISKVVASSQEYTAGDRELILFNSLLFFRLAI